MQSYNLPFICTPSYSYRDEHGQLVAASTTGYAYGDITTLIYYWLLCQLA